MTAHRLFNVALIAAITLATAVLGPALDAQEPAAKPTPGALAAHCKARHGPLAGVALTERGPVCNPFSGQLLAEKAAP